MNALIGFVLAALLFAGLIAWLWLMGRPDPCRGRDCPGCALCDGDRGGA